MVSSCRNELDKRGVLQSAIFLGQDFAWEVPREEYIGMLQGLFSLRGWYFVEIGKRGEASQNLKKQRFLLRSGVECDNHVLLIHFLSYLRRCSSTSYAS